MVSWQWLPLVIGTWAFSQLTVYRYERFINKSQYSILFNDWLKQPIGEKLRDAVWATSVTLSTLAFSSIEVSSYEQA